MKLLIALPTYNEEKVIKKTIDSVFAAGYKDVLVVNDGSTDKTLEEIKKTKVIVASHFKNLGLGVAIRTALKFARLKNYDALVTLDSDGQHAVSDIKNVLSGLKDQSADVVIGIRNFQKAKISWIRKLILLFSNLYTWMLFGFYSKDSQSGFRAFSKKAIKAINLKSERMEVSSELFLEIAKNRLKYKEVPIKVIYTKYSLSKGQKNTNMFRVGWKLLLNLFH